jgi:hypothetical protein
MPSGAGTIGYFIEITVWKYEDRTKASDLIEL